MRGRDGFWNKREPSSGSSPVATLRRVFFRFMTTSHRRTPRVFVIKGGPGVGKSTLCVIATEMLKRGYNVEIHHCASDNASLDAVVVPAAGIALIDGTAPHVYDPRHRVASMRSSTWRFLG